MLSFHLILVWVILLCTMLVQYKVQFLFIFQVILIIFYFISDIQQFFIVSLDGNNAVAVALCEDKFGTYLIK